MAHKNMSNGIEKTSYVGEVVYDENVVGAFCDIQFSFFQRKKQIILVLVSLGMVLIGISGIGGLVLAAICVPIGCWLLMSISAIPKRNADIVIQSYDGNFPKSYYSFKETCFTIISGKDSNLINYENIATLVEDNEYLYLFAAPQLAYIVKKESLKPHNVEKFKAFIANATGEKWQKRKSWWKKLIGR